MPQLRASEAQRRAVVVEARSGAQPVDDGDHGLLRLRALLFDVNMREHDKVIAAWVVMGIGIVTLLLVVPLPAYSKWESARNRVEWK